MTLNLLIDRLADTSRELAREIGWLAACTHAQHAEQLRNVESARTRRDVAAEAYRAELKRLQQARAA